MKIKITKFRHETIKEEGEVDITEKRMFYFITGIRQAYCVTPKWTTWKKEHENKEEEIYELDIITVDPTNKSIQKSNVAVGALPDIYKNGHQHPLYRLIENILYYPDDCHRTEEQFMTDFNSVSEQIKESL